MIEVNDQVLDKMVQAIVSEADPELIMLFGSRVREHEGSYSDVDLLIVVREPFGLNRSRRQELLRIRRALSSFRIPKDILVYSVEEMERYKNSLNHILAEALREGKPLYERP